MTLRNSIGVLSVVLPLASAACGHRAYAHGRMAEFRSMAGRQPMQHGMSDPVARLLDRQATLRLTAAQVNSLIAIDEKLIADNKPLRDRLMAWRPSWRRHGGGRGADTSNAGARAAQRDSAAAEFQQIRENQWRAANAAYAQLTDEQMRSVGRVEGGGWRDGGFGGPDGPGMSDGPAGSRRPGPREGPPGGGPGGGHGGPPSGSGTGSD